jgi:hypothetical protein
MMENRQSKLTLINRNYKKMRLCLNKLKELKDFCCRSKKKRQSTTKKRKKDQKMKV